MFLPYFCLLTLLGYVNSIQVDFTRQCLWISPKNEFLKSSDVNKTGYVDGSSDENLEWQKSLESENILMANFSLNYLGKGKNTAVKLDVCLVYGFCLLESLGLEFFNKIFGTEIRVEQCPISKV